LRLDVCAPNVICTVGCELMGDAAMTNATASQNLRASSGVSLAAAIVVSIGGCSGLLNPIGVYPPRHSEDAIAVGQIRAEVQNVRGCSGTVRRGIEVTLEVHKDNNDNGNARKKHLMTRTIKTTHEGYFAFTNLPTGCRYAITHLDVPLDYRRRAGMNLTFEIPGTRRLIDLGSWEVTLTSDEKFGLDIWIDESLHVISDAYSDEGEVQEWSGSKNLVSRMAPNLREWGWSEVVDEYMHSRDAGFVPR